MWTKLKLQDMKTAPKNDMILVDAGYGFLTVAHWNETEKCWVYAALNCNDGDGHDMYFENEYETKLVGWMPIPRVSR